MKVLRIILPDQLSINNPIYKNLNKDDFLLFYEPMDTFHEINHHKQKIVLLLSLISGRNPDLLIGQHVKSSFKLKQAEIEILSCGYILVETENLTSAIYMSESLPIPKSKSDIAAATALAGEQLGLNFIYMDTGSGAQQTINQKMIGTVKKNITVPLFVGGGINNQEQLESTWKAGADIAVVGTCIENDFNKMFEFKKPFL